jgi:hypothetical protein
MILLHHLRLLAYNQHLEFGSLRIVISERLWLICTHVNMISIMASIDHKVLYLCFSLE